MTYPRTVLLLLVCALVPGAQPGRAANDTPPATHAQVPTEGLLLPAAALDGRGSYPVAPVAARLVAGDWKAPHEGDTVALPNGVTRKWEAIRADKDGWFGHAGFGSGYVYLAVPAAEEELCLLEAAGHSMVYVNGEPRIGDTYNHGFVRIPVLLHKGTNDLLFRGGRFSKVRARLTTPKAPALFDTADLTLPDLLMDQEVKADAAVVVVNTTTAPADHLAVEAVLPGGASTRTPLPVLLPLGVRKVAFRLEGPSPREGGKADVELRLLRQEGDRWLPLDTAHITLSVVRSNRLQRRTFRSAIDGSVQYYALLPAATPGTSKEGEAPAARPGLILTLHGAAVEGYGQAACFAAKPWAHVVAPTNRRPFGFDWEDWGRLDAMEVLDLTSKELNTDPRRTYLTGHSMGGHGTWHIGATYPGRFAAIGPSAGWISLWSYLGLRNADSGLTGEAAHLADLLRRPLAPSDTLALVHNYALEGVYVLHGDGDDNVPVSEARSMRQQLGSFHPDFAYHEQLGAGHWWGNPCVDWPPMLDFFERHQLPRPEEVRHVDFATASPGVSAWCHWAGIEAQTEQGKLSSVDLQHDPSKLHFAGATVNVARLALDVGHLKPGETVAVELDGQKLAVPWPADGRRLWLRREGRTWSATGAPSAALKGPDRYGPFKEAFRNQVLFVYGTRGTPEETAAALAKARSDAETFWYHGNASVDVVPDTAWESAADRDRNVVLYGNGDTNAAWKALLGDSPVQVSHGTIRVGEREEKGEDLACVFVRPRPGSDRALVAAVAGTGVAGMRLTWTLPLFHSGVGYPDWVVLGPEVLARGRTAVRGAGFFGNDWGLPTGEFAWRP
jgi:hypothetical protein